MKLSNLIFGRPLETSSEHDHRIGVAAGIPIFGLDGLTSAAYGPEAAMSLLIPLGIAGDAALPAADLLGDPGAAGHPLLQLPADDHGVPERRRVVHGGEENLGDTAGLLAAAALMIDYILTAAVGVSAGVTALVSAVPTLHRHQLALCLLILAIIVVVNMRGVKESGLAFMLPTFLFVGTLLATIGGGRVARVCGGRASGAAGDSAAARCRRPMQYLTLCGC